MSHTRRSLHHVLAGAVVGTIALGSSALAADLPVKAPELKTIYNWTGFYLGGHTGYGSGSFGPNTNAEPLQGVFFPPSVTGMIGGFQAGYNRQLANKVVLGVEADISFGSPVDIPRLAPAPFNSTIDYIATARGRIGYAMGTWMPYVTGGIAWGTTIRQLAAGLGIDPDVAFESLECRRGQRLGQG